jgi:hypothetical protein
VEDANLNQVLSHNGIRTNVVRDSSVYRDNHAFWATRPLTAQMIEWATGDVRCMLDLYCKQMAGSVGLECAAAARVMQDKHLDMAREARVTTVRVGNIGGFIGKGGSRIRSLQRKSNTLVYPKGNRHSKLFTVYYHDRPGLFAVQHAADNA